MPDREQSHTSKHGTDEKPRREATEKGRLTSHTKGDHSTEHAGSVESGGPYMKDRDTEIAVEAGRKGGQTSRTEEGHPKERVGGAESGGPYKKDRDTEIAVEAGRKGRQQNVKR